MVNFRPVWLVDDLEMAPELAIKDELALINSISHVFDDQYSGLDYIHFRNLWSSSGALEEEFNIYELSSNVRS